MITQNEDNFYGYLTDGLAGIKVFLTRKYLFWLFYLQITS